MKVSKHLKKISFLFYVALAIKMVFFLVINDYQYIIALIIANPESQIMRMNKIMIATVIQPLYLMKQQPIKLFIKTLTLMKLM